MRDDSSLLSILVATDNHLGYKEKDSVREKDSFTTFEEVFDIAKERDVDFVLLGGDLFHENKPSRRTVHACMEIMRKHCLGARPSQVEVLSDQAVDFGHTSRTITCVNYEDPNVNISMPVFSIHGNHDDPAGNGALSAIDLLSVSGLLNHFGKTTNMDMIQISPVLLQKGSTKLALYGLGSIRDERLHRMFLKKKVEFLRPKEDTGKWFNIMVIHQNRAQHGMTNYIPEHFLDDFFDLVIWGHEHECLIEPQWNATKNFFVMQPGSSVATSLSPGESKQKQVAIVNIHGREMKVDPIPLRTVRIMYVEDIILSQLSCISLHDEASAEENIQRYCEERVLSLVQRARLELSGHPRQPKKPLIRLRIDYTGGYPTFNPHRLGGKFSETVANADSVIHFMKKSTRGQVKKEKDDLSDLDKMVVQEVVEKIRVEDLVEEYLSTADEKYQMSLLTAKGLGMAVRGYIETKEKDSVYDLCEYQLDKMMQHLVQCRSELTEDSILEQVARFKRERKAASTAVNSSLGGDNEDMETLHSILAKVKQSRMQKGVAAPTLDSNDEMNSSDNERPGPSVKPKRGRGARAGIRGSGRGRGRGRNAKTSTSTSLPVVEVSNKTRAASIVDAFKKVEKRSAMIKNTDITEVPDSEDDEDVPDIKNVPEPSKRPVLKRGRGVQFSSDEEQPMQSFLKSSKRRR